MRLKDRRKRRRMARGIIKGRCFRELGGAEKRFDPLALALPLFALEIFF
jgi:hypothetical protein